MPRVYRSMLADGNRPKTGNSAKTLGVRVGDNDTDDIATNARGVVVPNAGGMSVAPNWRELPAFRIPERLNEVLRREGLPPKARGSNHTFCWRLGDGPFFDGIIAENLALRVDSPVHGLVEPAVTMAVDLYVASLASTVELWIVDEQ